MNQNLSTIVWHGTHFFNIGESILNVDGFGSFGASEVSDIGDDNGIWMTPMTTMTTTTTVTTLPIKR
jgi:hypothetical protein